MSKARAVIGTVWSFIAIMVRDVVVAPLRDGTLNLRSHPPAIKGITWVVSGVVGILVAGIVFADSLRRRSALIAVVDDSSTSIVPEFLIPAMFFVLALAIALVLAGSQRVRLWLRVVLLLACIGILGDLVASSAVAATSPVWISWTALALLAAYSLLIWTGRTNAAADFFVMVVLTMVIALGSYRRLLGGNELMDIRIDLLTTSTLIITLTALAMPTAFMSGLSAAKLGVSLAVGAGTFVARRTNVMVASLILVVIIAHQIIVAAKQLRSRWFLLGPLEVLGATAGATVILAVCALVWWLAHQISGRWAVLEKDTSDIASTAALPIAYALMAPVLISNVIALFGATLTLGGSAAEQSMVIWLVQAFGSQAAVATARVGVIIGLVALGGWMIHKHRPRTAATLLIDAVLLTAVLFAVSPMRAVHMTWSVIELGNVGLVIGIVLFVRWLARRAITPDRLVLLYFIVLLSALIRRADYFSLPFGFLLGGSAVALLLIGLVWGFLTGGGDTHEDKPHYPRDGKLLLFLGTFLFSMAMLAWSTIGRQIELARELMGRSSLGLVTLGTAYIIVCILDSVHSWRRANRLRAGGLRLTEDA